MASLTREQINEINNKCSNGWQLDMQYFLMYREKTLIKRVRLDEQNFLEFILSYNNDNQIAIRISKYFHKSNETMAVSTKFGKWIILDETSAKRRSINNLIIITEKLTNEKLLELDKNSK